MVFLYILGINGSPNKNGNTFYLINEVLNECKALGADVEIINAVECLNTAKTPFCVACTNPCNKNCYIDTMLYDAYEKLKRADAIIFGSPVYFGSMTGQLKAFLDKGRALRGEKVLIGKKCGFITCGASLFGGQEATIKSMQACALVYGMTVIGPGSADFDAGHLGICAVRPSAEDENAKKRCLSMAHRIMKG